MKRCVVLGANGFIGNHLCRTLLAAGHQVVAFDIARDFSGLQDVSGERLETLSGDFLDRATVRQALRGSDWVFHLVSTTLPASSNQNMLFDVQSNVVASVALLEECRDHGVEKLVFASSGGTVYGVPETLPVTEEAATGPVVSYGVTKLMIEKYCYLFRHQFGLNSICLRLANPFGPGHHGSAQGAISVFLRRLLQGQPIVIWGDGSVVRDYLYIGDTADAFLRAACYRGSRHVFNIGSGQGYSLNQVIARLEAVTGRAPEVIFEAARGFDVPRIVLDSRWAHTELEWQPVIDLDEGIRLTWEALQGEQPT